MLISNLSYTHTGVHVGTTEFILIWSLYRGTRRYYRTHTYSSISDLILVFQILYMYYRTSTCLTEVILALQSEFLYFGYGSTRRCYRTFYLYKSTRRYYRTDSLYRGTRRYYRTYTYSCISDLTLVLQSIYLSYGSYTCITEHVLVLRILYLFYRAYSYTSDLIQSLFWYKSTRRYYTDSLYGGTCRYHWTYTYLTDTGVLVGTTEFVLILPIRKYSGVLQNLYLYY